MRRLLPTLALALVLAPLAPVTPATADASAPGAGRAAERAAVKIQTELSGWSGKQLASGRAAGTELRRGRLFLSDPVGTRTLGGTTYDVGRWVSRCQT